MSRLWIDFVNSDWHDYRGREADRDQLADPGWVARFLDEHGLPVIDPTAPRTATALHKLRDLLQRFIRTLVEDRPVGREDIDALNRYLAAKPVTTRVEVENESFRMRLVPESRDLDAVLFAIAESFALFLIEGDPTRLKLCDNPDCRWVFYDTTRSRTRRWCADTCGNLMKVRKFRAKDEKKRRKRGKSAG